MQSYGELAHHFGEEIGCYFAFMQVRGHGRRLLPLWLHYNTLQHTATPCNTLQHTATHAPSPCSTIPWPACR